MGVLMLFNLLGFNLSWFGLVIVGNGFIPVTLSWLALHLYLCQQRKAELKLLTAVAALGIVIDSLLISANVLVFEQNNFMPLWLMTLWLAFGATISHSLHMLAYSKTLQVVVGFIFPPLSYIAGSKLSAVQFGHNLFSSYLILGVIWAVLMMMCFHFKHYCYRPCVSEVSHD